MPGSAEPLLCKAGSEKPCVVRTIEDEICSSLCLCGGAYSSYAERRLLNGTFRDSVTFWYRKPGTAVGVVCAQWTRMRQWTWRRRELDVEASLDWTWRRHWTGRGDVCGLNVEESVTVSGHKLSNSEHLWILVCQLSGQWTFVDFVSWSVV